MRNILRRIISAVMVCLLIATAISSCVISVSAEEVELGTVTQNPLNSSERLMTGIDVSSWQGDIDWAQAKAAGVEFAMLRLCSHVPDTPNYTEDSKLARNISEAKAQGIHLGAYFFSYAPNLAAVETEANMVVEILKKYPATFDFPIVFDAETGDTTDGFDITNFAADACATFRRILEENGYYVMIYANTNWFNNVIVPSSKIEGCDLWQAHYMNAYAGYTPSQGTSVASSRPAINNNNQYVYMWQYTDSGVVSGVGNKIDMNVSYRDYSQIIPARGLNGFSCAHEYGFTYDADSHMDRCDKCGSRINEVPHDFKPVYDEKEHFLQCSCGYKKPKSYETHVVELRYDSVSHYNGCSCGYIEEGSVVEHVFSEYLTNETKHEPMCECGYKKPEADHEYTVKQSDQTSHWYECECGTKDMSTVAEHEYSDTYVKGRTEHYYECTVCKNIDAESLKPHTFVNSYDETNHYDLCEECGYKAYDSITAHTFEEYVFDEFQHFLKCECGYIDALSTTDHVYDVNDGKECVCGAIKPEEPTEATEATEETDETEEPEEETEYHEHDDFIYNAEEHWIDCQCGYVSDAEEHSIEGNVCKKCGYIVGELDDEPVDDDEDETTKSTKNTSKKPTSDDEDEEETGCESSLSTTVVLATSIVIGAGFLVKKKKED